MAKPIPDNLGPGLAELATSQAALRIDPNAGTYNGFATEAAANAATLAITDSRDGRVMVDIVPTGSVAVDTLVAKLRGHAASFEVKATDASYRGVGMIEAFVTVDDAVQIAKTPGVRSVFLALKPVHHHSAVPVSGRAGTGASVVPGGHLRKLGSAFDQGVIQHRVDRINQFYNAAAPVNYNGTGISIGVLSDSFDTSGTGSAATDLANFDLPGSASHPAGNTAPVIVLEDFAGGTDEGRGMMQIVHKMAPSAKLAFATADTGELGFANNIRALAGLPGFTKPPATQQGFAAQVIVDDVGYFDEPFYTDGIVSRGVDDVAAAGVSYFSSAGNDIGINGYESELRIVPNGTGTTSATNTALVNTNINLTGVPANLYAGGFHNFNPTPGQTDVAQLVNYNYTGTSPPATVMQWNDPYDTRDLTLNQPPIYSNSGTISAATTTVSFDGASAPPLPTFTAGAAYVITETATSGDLDAIISIFDAGNNLILSQDTGADETVNFYPPTSGQYKITVGRFQTTTGNFNLTVNTAVGTAGVTTDLNLLVFNAAGAYQATRSLTSNNLATNRPIELGQFTKTGTQLQFVIARGNTPSGPNPATRVHYTIGGNGLPNLGPAEYFTYNAPTTGGHAMAKGCNGTAAYAVFRANTPETFTSPGPITIYFDANSNRLVTPELRQQPRLAGVDGGNTSFFAPGGDDNEDSDANPNFYGTSAAAPHAAAIAALVLQSRGGPGSVTPTQMTSILQASTYPHDLDPSSASGTATTTDGGGVVVTVDSDGENYPSTGTNDTSSFKISYVGAGSLASISFNPANTDVGGGNPTGGNNGPNDDAGSSPATITYTENNFPGMIFMPATKAFTLGPLTGLVAADVVGPTSTTPFTGFANLAPTPGNGSSQFRTMTIGFPTGQFGDGKVLRFTVGRGQGHSAVVTTANGTVVAFPLADTLGGGVSIPSGVITADGMSFTGTTTSGGKFSGTIRNSIGRGYSNVDGYGLIDAQAATNAVPGSPTVVSAAPFGLGSSAPAFAAANGSVLLTVKVTAGTSPASTGITVTGDLTAIGGPAAQTLFDDGTHGDVTAADGTYSFGAAIGAAIAVGGKNVPVTISDAQARSGSTLINVSVISTTGPSAVGLATPASVAPGAASLLTAALTAGSNPISTGMTARVDLSSIGGSANQVMFDNATNGDVLASNNTFSFNYTVPAATSGGVKTLPLMLLDAQGRASSGTISLTVTGPTSPTASATSTPSSQVAGGTVLLTVNVTPGTNPTSSGITVSANLTAIGGSASQAFHDDGLNGDATAGDNVWSYQATIAGATGAGTKNMPVSVSDGQARSAGATIVLDVTSSADTVFSDGFE